MMSTHTMSIEKKVAILDVLSAREKLSLAQSAHEVEVKALEECEKAVCDAFRAKVPMDKFLQLRESKRIQARVVRDSFRTLVAAMNALDEADTKYDMILSATDTR